MEASEAEAQHYLQQQGCSKSKLYKKLQETKPVAKSNIVVGISEVIQLMRQLEAMESVLMRKSLNFSSYQRCRFQPHRVLMRERPLSDYHGLFRLVGEFSISRVATCHFAHSIDDHLVYKFILRTK